MAWTRVKTIRILIILIFLSLIFAGITIGLISFAILQHSDAKMHDLTTHLPYLIATTYGTGFGCIWYRLTRARKDNCHAFIHSATLICMIISHREVFQLCWEGEYAKSYNLFAISWLSILTYVIQFSSTIYLVVTKFGDTPREKVQNMGLHASFGAIIFFICIADGLLLCHRISKDLVLENEVIYHFASISVFFYGMTIWYIMLNHYFDYRRYEQSRSGSKSPSRSRTPMRRIRRSLNLYYER